MRIAIITRSYERPGLLRRAWRSLLDQPGADMVWSLVNDGGDPAPVDREAQAARAAGLPTVVTHLESNMGRATSANAGVRAVDSDAVILLDDDDRLLPGALPHLSQILAANPGDAGVVGQVYKVMEKPDRQGGFREISRKIVNPEAGPVRLVDLAYRNFVPVNGFLYRRSVYDEINGYDESLPVMEDWDFVLRIVRKYDVLKTNRAVSEYFVRPTLDNGAGPLGNSIIAEHQLHEEWNTRIRNRYLRADLDNKEVGLGHMMNPPHILPMERINAVVNYINSASERVWILRRALQWLRKK